MFEAKKTLMKHYPDVVEPCSTPTGWSFYDPHKNEYVSCEERGLSRFLLLLMFVCGGGIGRYVQ